MRHKADRIYQRGVRSMLDLDMGTFVIEGEGTVKLALVTTTINVPEVLRLYRAYGSDVTIFVASDDRTPSIIRLAGDLGFKTNYPEIDDDTWKCSKLIGRNTIGRRSIAILEALKSGAEIIISIDDDNLPMDEKHFFHFKYALMPGVGWSGLQVGEPGYWLDYGRWLDPSARQRGIPPDYASVNAFSFVTGAKVGVAQGICLGNPDTDALTRLVQTPVVHQVSQLLHSGVVVHPQARTVHNTQNVAFLRELAPCFLMVPQFKRFDDIFASLICRRIMRETGHYLHLGQPFAWQARNDHNLLTDLKKEMWGMEYVVDFADWLDGLDLGQAPHPLHYVRLIYGKIGKLPWMPVGVSELGLAWCDDCESVL